MADIRRFGPADLLLLLLVLAVAAGIRAGYLSTCADGGRNAGPLRVQDARRTLFGPGEVEPARTDLEALIRNVREHGWFGCLAPFATGEEKTAHISPGYPWLVGLLGRVTGEGNDRAVRWIQVVLGALTAGLYYLFARRAFRSLLVGFLAGLFTALHPFWIIGTATIDDGVLAAFALAGCLFLGSQAGEKGGALLSLLFGLALAGLALVRASMLPFSFIALIWFLLRSRTLQRGWLCALLAFLGFANGLATWTVRNIQVYDEPLPVVSSAYLHLWMGNNPYVSGGPATPELLQSAPNPKLWSESNQAARYALLGREVSQEVRDHPVQTLRRRMRAAIMFFVGARWLKDGSLAEPTDDPASAMPNWLEEAYPLWLQAVLLAMMGLAVLGWRWSYGWRWESVMAAIAMIWVPIPFILSHAEALSGPRLPLDGVLLCYVAFGLVCLVPGLNGPLLEATDAGRPATT
jgi:4-amino-4-deoxy-L-arabinose transferase-like glycosyltransferase